jgi:hypothetical protein
VAPPPPPTPPLWGVSYRAPTPAQRPLAAVDPSAAGDAGAGPGAQPLVAAPGVSAAPRPAPMVSPATNAYGLTSRGEFVVDPTAVLVVPPGSFPAVPDDPAGRYLFGMRPTGGGRFEPVLPGRRCVRPELASAVQNVGLRFWTVFGSDGLRLVVGEGNSDGDHATHYGGGYIDLYTNFSNRLSERFVERDGGPHPHVAALPFVAAHLARGGRLTYEESIGLWLAMALVDSRQVRRIVFELDTVNLLAEAYAAQQGVPFDADAIRSIGNRTHTYHVHAESRTDGASRSCAR